MTRTKTTPGLKRLRSHPKAEQIRADTLADQRRARAEARARIEATPAEAQKRPAGGRRSIPASKPGRQRKGPPAARLAPAKGVGKRAALLAAAGRGEMPSPPDFSAPTHTRFRPKLAEVVALAEAGDLKALRSYRYEGFHSTSPKAILRYRDLAVIALEARQ
jgi:hypothetical protein